MEQRNVIWIKGRCVVLGSVLPLYLLVHNTTLLLFHFQAKPTLNDQHLLKNFFFNPSFLRDDRAIDELLVGLTLTPVQRADDNFANDVSTYYYEGAAI